MVNFPISSILNLFIAFFSATVAIGSYSSFLRTRDKDLAYICAAFFSFFIFQTALGFSILNAFNDVPSYVSLKALVVLSKIFLHVGVILFMQISIYQQTPLFKKYNKYIVFLALAIMVVFLLLQFVAVEAPTLTDSGVLMENLSPTVASMSLIVPIFSIFSLITFLLVRLPKGATIFFKVKIYALCIGVFVAVLGNTIYVFARSEYLTVAGLILLIFGYFLMMFSILLPSVRRLILKHY